MILMEEDAMFAERKGAQQASWLYKTLRDLEICFLMYIQFVLLSEA